ncbi:MAG TPA: DUF5719 family protein [Mycobacteriales bacterium]|nr:DUF5719 family protein [Mycobacteriales bacterium]
MTRPPIGLLLAVAVLAGGTAVTARVSPPRDRRAEAERVEVLGATAVCPDVHQVPGLFQSRISVGVGPLPPGRSAAGGEVSTAVVDSTQPPTPTALRLPGQVVVGLGTTLKDGAVAVRATGPLATSLEVEQVARVNDGTYRGLAGMRCEAPKRDAWFMGASTGLSDRAVLVLANVDDSPATVDVTVFGRQGRADARPGQGLTVAPHRRLLLPMETLAPDMKYLVTHVRSRQGRVVATLRHSRFITPVPLGFDFVPQALPPARKVVVPGIPQGPGYRSLLLGNPSQDDTTVSLQVTTKDGQFVPSGMNEIDVPAGRTVVVRMDKLTDPSPVTVTVTSSGAAVVASSFLIDWQLDVPGSLHDIAYGGSTLPLTGPALLTDLVIDRPTESTLLLTAPEGPATVVVTPIKVLGAAGALPAPRRLTVAGGRTIAFRLSTFFPPGTHAQLAVEVRPEQGSGPVYATRYLRERGGRGLLATLLALQGPAQLVDRPAAVQDDEAGYP